jgi:hypothetical protein
VIAVIPDAMRIALGVVFLVSGVTKSKDLGSFEKSIRDYEILPPASVRSFAWLVVTSELAIAGLFLASVAVPIVGAAALALLLVFGIAIALALVRGRRPACGCFGPSSEPVSPRSLLRIGALIGLDLGAAYGPSAFVVSSLPNPFADLFVRLTIGVFIVVMGGWILALPRPFQRWIDLVAEIRSGGN